MINIFSLCWWGSNYITTCTLQNMNKKNILAHAVIAAVHLYQLLYQEARLAFLPIHAALVFAEVCLFAILICLSEVDCDPHRLLKSITELSAGEDGIA